MKGGGRRFVVDPIKPGTRRKVHPTKAAYHGGRDVFNVVDRPRSTRR